jgi:hypothetical protein
MPYACSSSWFWYITLSPNNLDNMARHSKQKAHLARLNRARQLQTRNVTVPAPEVSYSPSDRPGASYPELNPSFDPSTPCDELLNDHASAQDEDSELSSEESSSDDEGESDSSAEEMSEAIGAPSLGSDMGSVGMLRWTDEAEKAKTLKRPYGSGSDSTEKRRRRHQRELGEAAKNTLNIADLLKRQQELGTSMSSRPDPPSTSVVTPLRVVSPSVLANQTKASALKDLEKLLRLKTEQIRIYGRVLPPTSDFFRRHCMVKSFLYVQQQTTGKTRREMANAVATTFNRGGHTGRMIIKYERQWIEDRTIPESRAGKHNASLSLLEDEGILCAVRDFTKTQGEGKSSSFLLKIRQGYMLIIICAYTYSFDFIQTCSISR